MKRTKVAALLTVASGVALTLAACGNNSSNKAKDDSANTDFPIAVSNKKEAKQGGTLKVAVETDTPFTGIFNAELSDSAIDAEVSRYGDESLFKIDKNYKIIDGGAADMKLDLDKKTETITINKKVKWSDGKPLVADDVVYSYKIVGNKLTKSSRYTDSLQNIVGYSDYHDGKSDEISGIETPNGGNGDTVVIHFKEMKPGMTQSGSGYQIESASPYHQLKNVAFDKLTSSDEIRKTPLYFGPYKLNKIVRGQSVEWVPNTYYYGNKPKLDKIVASVVNPNNVAQSIKSNKYDLAMVMNSQWKNVKDTKNVEFVAHVPLSYSYLGFKVGKWDAAKGENVENKNAKMNDKALRQAIAYAMNVDQVYKKYSSGLTFRIPTLIPAEFKNYFNSDVKGYDYNIKKANEILDKAGYKKKGEYRQTPEGKDLVVNMAAMSGSKTAEPIMQNYIQQWKSIGIHVKLATGRLIEFNSFYDKVQNDDPSIDMFMGAWSLSSEPSPNDLYNAKAPYNFTRFNTAENTKLLKEIDSEKAFDASYREKAFKDWQEYMNEEAYVVPVANNYEIYSVNKKVVGFDLTPSSNSSWADVGFQK